MRSPSPTVLSWAVVRFPSPRNRRRGRPFDARIHSFVRLQPRSDARPFSPCRTWRPTPRPPHVGVDNDHLHVASVGSAPRVCDSAARLARSGALAGRLTRRFRSSRPSRSAPSCSTTTSWSWLVTASGFTVPPTLTDASTPRVCRRSTGPRQAASGSLYADRCRARASRHVDPRDVPRVPGARRRQPRLMFRCSSAFCKRVNAVGPTPCNCLSSASGTLASCSSRV
jgi:hypothetical protein